MEILVSLHVIHFRTELVTWSVIGLSRQLVFYHMLRYNGGAMQLKLHTMQQVQEIICFILRPHFNWTS